MQRIRIAALRGRDPLRPTDRRARLTGRAVQRLEANASGPWSNALTSVGKDNLLFAEWA